MKNIVFLIAILAVTFFSQESCFSISKDSTEKTPIMKSTEKESVSSLNSDTIQIEEGALGNKYFYHNSQLVEIKDYKKVCAGNNEALDKISSASTNSTVADIFGCVGGFLIGWPLGAYIGGGKPTWELAYAGLGMVAIAIPFILTAESQLKDAVQIYNNFVQSGKKRETSSLKLFVSPLGISLALRF